MEGDSGFISDTGSYDINELDVTQQLDVRQQHGSCLITYSQEDFPKFPTRESYANCVVELSKLMGFHVISMLNFPAPRSMFHVTWTTFKLNRNQLGTVSAYVM